MHMERNVSVKGISDRSGVAVSTWLRAGLAVFALVLTAQASWILLAELQHPRGVSFPLDRQESFAARPSQDDARRSAELAVVRGDLWAESAFAYSSPLWMQRGTTADTASVDQARADLERALRYAPHRGDVWLLLAAMAGRYNWPRYNVGALLKMSYYTAPNEQVLFPSRIKVSLAAAAALHDRELADMVRRDIRLLITRAPAQKPALVAIYKSASGSSRQFVERVVSEIDPAWLAGARTESQ